VSTEDDDLVPLSGLQHVVFCPRQAALIHVERVWREDAATAAGRVLHERVDEPGIGNQRGVRIARSMPLVSRRLGVRGIADMVELHADDKAPRGVRPVPIEVKRGRVKRELADQVQLCAQAMCLEEQFSVTVVQGALFYGGSHRRVTITFDGPLRQETERAARLLRDLISRGEVPPAVYLPAKCGKCSLEPLCLPKVTQRPTRGAAYLARLVEQEGSDD
jgi:CRISPR-associated exonuclease Cas4